MPPEPELLARAATLLDCHPEVESAWLFGSITGERYRPESDVDIALLCKRSLRLDELVRLDEQFADLFGNERIDLVQLANADPLLRFEAICGCNLKRGALEQYCRFVSETSREYEEALGRWQRSLCPKCANFGQQVSFVFVRGAVG